MGPTSYNEGFYEKHAIKITHDQTRYDRTPKERDVINKFHDIALYENPRIGIFEKAIRDYPHLPELKNYLFMVYRNKGAENESRYILADTRKMHPNYFFGIMNEVETHIEYGALDIAAKMLKSPFESFFPNTEIYEDNAFLTYQAVCIQYDLANKDLEAANAKHELMFDLDPEDEKTDIMAKLIVAFELGQTAKSFSADSDKYLKVASFPTVVYEANNDMPAYMHSEIESFYVATVEDMFEDEIQEIMNLPKASLVEDLRKVVEHAIRSFPIDSEDQKFGDDSIVHALYFLGALKDEESLPLILDLFRQGEACIYFWFGEYFPHCVEDSLYFIGRNQLNVLKDFLFEPNVYSEPRVSIIKMVGQIALHESNRKEEVKQWIKDVFEKMLDLENNKTIIESFVIGELINVSTDLGFKDFEVLAERACQKEWLPNTFMGNWDVIHKRFAKGANERFKVIFPSNIVEFYRGVESLDDSEKLPDQIIEDFFGEGSSPHKQYMQLKKIDLLSLALAKSMPEEHNDDGEFYLDDDTLFLGDKSEFQSQGTFRNTKPKVGRNDSCPCGSGKKFKKCCINKGIY